MPALLFLHARTFARATSSIAATKTRWTGRGRGTWIRLRQRRFPTAHIDWRIRRVRAANPSVEHRTLGANEAAGTRQRIGGIALHMGTGGGMNEAGYRD